MTHPDDALNNDPLYTSYGRSGALSDTATAPWVELTGVHEKDPPSDHVTVIRAGRAIVEGHERSACVVIRHGRVVDILEHVELGAARVVELSADEVLLPGLVDTHVHVNEPGRSEWEGFASATAAALAGGITTIVDMPLNSVPATVDVDALAVKRAVASGQLAADVAFWGGAIPGNAGQLRGLHDAGVVGFKCFLLPSGVEEFPPLGDAGLAEAMRVIAAFDGLLIAHAEDETVMPHEAGTTGPRFADFLASRPDRAETLAVERLIEHCRRTGCRTHVVHLSSAQTLPVVRAAKEEGLPLTVETCPHYLIFDAETVPDGATQFKSCPPIRSGANREALWEALVDGTIDIVVSDHSPCTAELKRFDTGDFAAAWGGIASLQLGLAAVWTEARQRGIGLDQIAQWMATGPADLVRLAERGRIAPGSRADFAVLAPEESFVVDPRALAHRNPITPYAGRTLFGMVRQTWLAGVVATADARRGRCVRSEEAPWTRP